MGKTVKPKVAKVTPVVVETDKVEYYDASIPKVTVGIISIPDDGSYFKDRDVSTDTLSTDATPEKPLTSAEAGSLHAYGHRFTEPIKVTQEGYDRLLSAYNSLKQRSGLDPHIERQLDAQAGLI